MSTIRESIYAEITEERQYQVQKWGNDAVNTPWMWAAYIAQYATSWMKGEFLPVRRSSTDLFRQSMLKVACLAVAAIESVDRQRGLNGQTFYEQEVGE
jgi:hypothetical protein